MAEKDPIDRKNGLDKLSGALKQASANIADAAKPMTEKAREALGIIPEGVFYDPEEIRFVQDDLGLGVYDILPAEFFEQWHSRWEDFPQLAAQSGESGEQVNSTIPPVVDAEALAAEVYDFSHLGTQTEFTDRRKARLREDMEDIKAQVNRIDAEIAYLNERRTNAMLAYSGISADLTAMDK